MSSGCADAGNVKSCTLEVSLVLLTNVIPMHLTKKEKKVKLKVKFIWKQVENDE